MALSSCWGREMCLKHILTLFLCLKIRLGGHLGGHLGGQIMCNKNEKC
nr:MAG TPA: hypothetical protein [Caudoviricetes sp.]